MREITRRPWLVGAIATRLSGLSETSWGDGRDKRNVVHAKCLEDIPFGRVLRKKGSFFMLAGVDALGCKREGPGRRQLPALRPDVRPPGRSRKIMVHRGSAVSRASELAPICFT
jgi:hypothetical protein